MAGLATPPEGTTELGIDIIKVARIRDTLKSDAVRPTGVLGFVSRGLRRPRRPGLGGGGSGGGGEPPAAP